MPQAPRRTLFLGLIYTVAVIALATDQRCAAEGSPAVATPVTRAVKGSAELFELRIYTTAPSKMEALHKRFREDTLKFFEKHGKKAADAKYTYVLEPLNASVTEKSVVVRARLTGNFPGSP